MAGRPTSKYGAAAAASTGATAASDDMIDESGESDVDLLIC